MTQISLRGLAILVLVLSGFTFPAQGQEASELDALLAQSGELLQQNRIAEAVELLESGLDDHADSLEIRNNLAIAYLGDERFDEALALMRSLAAQDRELNIINHNLAELENSNRGADPIDPIVFVERAPLAEAEMMAAQTDTPVADAQSAAPASNPEANPVAGADDAMLIAASLTPSEADIRQMVDAWAAAWSSKDFENYISFYANEFEPSGQGYADWRAFRLDMVTKPGPIELRLENFDISIYSYEIRARFDQHYVSDDYSDDIRKLLVIDTRDGYWKIVREATLEVY